MKIEKNTNLEIERWFPTTIGVVDWQLFDTFKDDYINHLSNLEYSESGFNPYEIHKDDKFKNLNDWITFNVNEYAKKHLFNHNYMPYESWVNNYPENHFQPYHTHNGWTISTVFYLSADEDDAKTNFKSPYYADMKNPQGISPHNNTDPNKFNDYTYQISSYKPVEGRLLIFRSFVEHSTDKKVKGLKNRIIFSYNYDPKE